MFFVPMNILNLFSNISEFGVFTALPQITSIDKLSFKSSEKLRSVFIVGQQIKSLGPRIFKGATAVTSLFLQSNQIENIHERAFEGLEACRYLVLSNNRITSLEPETFSPMPNLWSANLKKNQLTVLTGAIFASNHLAILDLSYNNLKKIPKHVVENFVHSNERLKVLAVLRNHCSDGVYTKESRKVEKSMRHCTSGALNERNFQAKLMQGVVKMREKILELENEKKLLSAENKELKNIVNTPTEVTCQIEKCRIVVREEFTEQRTMLKNLLPVILQWKKENRKLSESIASLPDRSNAHNVITNASHNETHEQTTISTDETLEFPIEEENSIESPKHEMREFERKLHEMLETVQNLQHQNKNLTLYVNALIAYIDERIHGTGKDMIGSVDELLLLSNETSTSEIDCMNQVIEIKEKLSFVEQEYKDCVVESESEAHEIKELTERLSFVEQEYRDCVIGDSETEAPIDCSHETLPLKTEILQLKGQNLALIQEAEACVNGSNPEELREALVKLNIQAVVNEETIEKLAEGMTILQQESFEIEEEKQEIEFENLNLKEDITDCKTLHHIEEFEHFTRDTTVVIEEMNLELMGIYESLRRLTAQNPTEKRFFPPDPWTKASRDADMAMEIIDDLKNFFKMLFDEDAAIDGIVEHIHATVSLPSRRMKNHQERQEVNDKVLDDIIRLRMLIKRQKDIVEREDRDVKRKLAIVLQESEKPKKRLLVLGMVHYLHKLNLLVTEKDKLLRNKYNKMETMTDGLEKTWNKGIEAKTKYHHDEQHHEDEFRNVEDMLKFVEKKKHAMEVSKVKSHSKLKGHNHYEGDREHIDEAQTNESDNLAEIIDLKNKIEVLEAVNRACNMTASLNCNDTDNCREVDEMLLDLNLQILRKEHILAKLADGIKLLKEEILELENTKDLENFELKEEIADCETYRKIDGIKVTVDGTSDEIDKKENEIEDLITKLRSISTNDDLTRKDFEDYENRLPSDQLSNQFEITKKEQEPLSPMQDIIDRILNLYESFGNGTTFIVLTIDEINEILLHPMRKSMSVTARQEINKDVLDHVNTLNSAIETQKQQLEKLDNKVKEIIESYLSSLDASKMRKYDEASDYLMDLNKAFNDKDELILKRYEKIATLTAEMEKARNEAIEAAIDVEKDENDIFQFDEIDRMLDDFSDDSHHHDDENLEPVVGQQLKRIADLRNEGDNCKHSIEEQKNKFAAMRKKCESCRGTWSKVQGTISSWFGSTSNSCDF